MTTILNGCLRRTALQTTQSVQLQWLMLYFIIVILESIHYWCNRYPHPKGGYGGRFVEWIFSDNPTAYNSYGNGAAMRVSPVAHWYEDEFQVLDAAAATAIPTHNHDEGVKGAQTVALAIFKAMEFNRYHYQEAALHIDEIIKECVDFSGYDIDMPKSSVLNKFDETCQGTVPVALKIISMSTCFEDALRLAVSLGADADTLGAIVGSIAESIWGIPLSIRSGIRDYLPEEMELILMQFHSARPRSFKPLIDTTYAGDDFSDVSWDVLCVLILDTVKRRPLIFNDFRFHFPPPYLISDKCSANKGRNLNPQPHSASGAQRITAGDMRLETSSRSTALN